MPRVRLLYDRESAVTPDIRLFLICFEVYVNGERTFFFETTVEQFLHNTPCPVSITLQTECVAVSVHKYGIIVLL